MLNYSRIGKASNLKYNILHFYNKNKTKGIVLSFIVFVCLLTGIFTAFKIGDIDNVLKSVEFSFESLIKGDVYELAFFLRRCFSILIVVALLFIFSLAKFTRCFGYVLLGYRSFLLSLNCALIIRYMGIGGIINSAIIIFPCQLLEILLMACLFIVATQIFKEKKECGGFSSLNSKWLLYILFGCILVSFIEFLLLLIFKATTILII